jgi:hypothetical protein
VIGDDALNDLADRAPADPEQPRDRRERHLLRQPHDHVFEVARVSRVGPSPRHRLEPNAAVRAAQAPQLSLDEAPAGAQVKVSPALDPPVVDLQVPAGLAAPTTDPTPARERNCHDHTFARERDVFDAGAGQTQQALECGDDPHVVLLLRPLAVNSQQPARRTAADRPRSAQPPKESVAAEAPARTAITPRTSPPNRAETREKADEPARRP